MVSPSTTSTVLCIDPSCKLYCCCYDCICSQRISTLKVCRLRCIAVVWSNRVVYPDSISCLICVEVLMSKKFHTGAPQMNIGLIKILQSINWGCVTSVLFDFNYGLLVLAVSSFLYVH